MLIIEKNKYKTIHLEIIEELENIFANTKIMLNKHGHIKFYKSSMLIAEFDGEDELCISRKHFEEIYKKWNNYHSGGIEYFDLFRCFYKKFFINDIEYIGYLNTLDS